MIRLIIQFLRENGLHRTLTSLQEESGVSLNCLTDTSGFLTALREGHWETVLQSLSTVSLPPSKLIDVYELLVLELASRGELEVARMVLRKGTALQSLHDDGEAGERRLQRIENHISIGGTVETFFNGVSMEGRRARVAQKLSEELVQVPSGRLLALLGDALNSQISADRLPPDTVYDIFHGVVPKGAVSIEGVVDVPVGRCSQSRQFPVGSHVECAAFSSNGGCLIVGLADGFIEVINPVTGQRRLDLPYQQTGESTMMVMDHPVICASFNPDGSILAVGTHGGEAAIWRVDNGSCLARFPLLHKEGISMVKLSRDGQLLLSAGYDGFIRITAIRSRRTVKEFNLHDSFVTDCSFSPDEQLVFSCGADGRLIIYDLRKGSSIATLTPFSSDQLTHGAIVKIILDEATSELLVCSKAGGIVRIGFDGKVISDRKIGQPVFSDSSHHGTTVSVTCSPRQKYLYILHSDGHCSVVDRNITTTAQLVTDVMVSTVEPIGCVSHPLYNQLVTFDIDGALKFWNPK